MDEEDIDQKLTSNISIWINSCTVNTPLDNAVTTSGNKLKHYLDIEDSFSNEDGLLLSSDLLDEVIWGKEDIMSLYPNGALAWSLANHKQTYALNYQNQKNLDERSILYFYMSSIKETERSLAFEMDIKTKIKRIRYLQGRYKDIADCKVIDDAIRFRALEIYIAIDNVLEDL